MKYSYLNVIGLMSGTSMDGIDISLVQTNGKNLKRLNENYFHKYSNETKKVLMSVLKNKKYLNTKTKQYLDEIITNEHFLALKDLKILKSSDLIGFHGQTIYHNPQKQTSIQLGDPKRLSEKLKKNVIFGFRSQDINEGGQGAPIAPIYHQNIMEEINLELPSCFLNIGGVSNITYWDGTTLIGFDTGPGNALIDDYVKISLNRDYDDNGDIAFQGSPDKEVINKFTDHNYFKKSPPKSLDRNSFIHFYDELLSSDLSTPNIIATLTEFTIKTIEIGIKSLPKKIKNIVIVGGGYRNKYIVKRLVEKLDLEIINEDEININFDFVESELIAFLSARSIYNLPITFPSTTGVSIPTSGGTLYTNL